MNGISSNFRKHIWEMSTLPNSIWLCESLMGRSSRKGTNVTSQTVQANTCISHFTKKLYIMSHGALAVLFRHLQRTLCILYFHRETEEVLWFARKMGNGIKSGSSASESVVDVAMSLEFTQKSKTTRTG